MGGAPGLRQFSRRLGGDRPHLPDAIFTCGHQRLQPLPLVGLSQSYMWPVRTVSIVVQVTLWSRVFGGRLRVHSVASWRHLATMSADPRLEKFLTHVRSTNAGLQLQGGTRGLTLNVGRLRELGVHPDCLES